MEELGVYGGLFLLSFLAATFLPAQSEFGLVGLILAQDYSLLLLVTVASVGNTLGSVVNWLLGRSVDRFSDRKWFPVSPAQMNRACGWYRKYGQWSLLLSWAPFIGDPLTLAAGVLREPFGRFLLLVAIAKTGRYIVVAALTV
ncbi:YqaA family protein [Nisaea sp.]|uniref:YqaA family protein n=1 Tax=Nisaea sp. TaxID=2024842 RepID=UPI0032EAE3BE